jgi:hypothetical protein
MGPSLPAKEYSPGNDCPPKLIVSSSFIPTFSGDVTHNQNNCTPLPDRVQEDLRHWLTRWQCDRRFVILNREEQTEDEEPAEDRNSSDHHDDANWSRYARSHQILNTNEKTDELCAMYALRPVRVD